MVISVLQNSPEAVILSVFLRGHISSTKRNKNVGLNYLDPTSAKEHIVIINKELQETHEEKNHEVFVNGTSVTPISRMAYKTSYLQYSITRTI